MRRRGTSFNAKRSITKERRVGRNTYARKFRLRGSRMKMRVQVLSIGWNFHCRGKWVDGKIMVDPLWISIRIETVERLIPMTIWLV